MTDYSKFFETKKRKSTGESFVKLRDDAPECLGELIRDIHFDCFDGCLPNDWIYSTVLEAFEAAEYERDLENVCLEPDPYYYQLNEWLTNSFARDLCNEVMDEYKPTAGILFHARGDYSPLKTIHDIIGYAQCRAKRMIYDKVQSFLDTQREVNGGD